MKSSFLLSLLIGGVLALSLTSCETPDLQPPISVEEPEGLSNRQYIGKPLQVAGDLADSRGVRWRVVEIDGVPQMTTKDYRPDRLNFAVRRGTVAKVSRG